MTVNSSIVELTLTIIPAAVALAAIIIGSQQMRSLRDIIGDRNFASILLGLSARKPEPVWQEDLEQRSAFPLRRIFCPPGHLYPHQHEGKRTGTHG